MWLCSDRPSSHYRSTIKDESTWRDHIHSFCSVYINLFIYSHHCAPVPPPLLVLFLWCVFSLSGSPFSFQLIQTLKRLMRPSSVEFKSPLELSAQGESTTHTHTQTQLVTRLHMLLLVFCCVFDKRNINKMYYYYYYNGRSTVCTQSKNVCKKLHLYTCIMGVVGTNQCQWVDVAQQRRTHIRDCEQTNRHELCTCLNTSPSHFPDIHW